MCRKTELATPRYPVANIGMGYMGSRPDGHHDGGGTSAGKKKEKRKKSLSYHSFARNFSDIMCCGLKLVPLFYFVN